MAVRVYRRARVLTSARPLRPMYEVYGRAGFDDWKIFRVCATEHAAKKLLSERASDPSHEYAAFYEE